MKNSLGLVLIFLILIPQSVYSQIRGTVIEKKTGQPISFASVTYRHSSRLKGVTTDINGNFIIRERNVKTVNVSYLGYKTIEVNLEKEKNLQNIIIKLEEESFYLNEVLVTPENNPALRIIRNVLKNKNQNNFEKYGDYSYQCYLKSTSKDKYTPKASKQTQDTILPATGEETLFINETVTKCYTINNNTRSEIVASNTTGFEKPYFAILNQEAVHTMISFYNSSVSFFKETEGMNKMSFNYVSPLSNNCISAYVYELENEYIEGNDTVFEISYYPKKSKNFNGLKGQMHISSDGFAVAGISAMPAAKKDYAFKLKQDYEKQDGRWFPSRLEQEMELTLMNYDDSVYIHIPVFTNITVISDVKYLNAEEKTGFVKQKKRDNGFIPQIENIYVDKKSIKFSDSILNVIRPDTLSLQEKEIIGFWKDSVNFTVDGFIESVTKLYEKRLAIGMLDIDFSKIYRYNQYEKNRLGLGLYTNERLIKNLSFGGYGMYGFGDKKWKYGGEIDFTASKLYDIKFRYQYNNILREAGGTIPDRRNFTINTFFRETMSYRFDHVEEHKLDAYFHLFRNLKFNLNYNIRQNTPKYAYTYKRETLSKYKSENVQLSLRYAHGEKFIKIGASRIPIASGNPVVNLTYTRGTNLIYSEAFQYNKIEGSLYFNLHGGRIGQSNFLFKGGYIDSSLPYGMLFTGEGSGDKYIPYLIPNSFQTMKVYEFLSDKYIHFFYSHNFGSLFIKTKYFSPEIMVVQNSGWGNLKNPENHGIEFKKQDKFFFESGLMLNSLLNLKVTFYKINFGAGFFYRYGHYGYDNFKDNYAVKLSIKIGL